MSNGKVNPQFLPLFTSFPFAPFFLLKSVWKRRRAWVGPSESFLLHEPLMFGLETINSAFWKEKRVLVTGATSGFGLVLAEELLRQGAHILICGRDAGRLERAVQGLKAIAAKLEPASTAVTASEGTGRQQKNDSRVAGLPLDVTCAHQLDRLFGFAKERWGGLDALMHMAGRSSRGKLLDVTAQEFRDSLEINFLSAAECVVRSLALMDNAISPRIVLMGSLAAKAAGKGMGPYSAAKFPLAAYAQQLRLELGGAGPKVLLVCPGPIEKRPSLAPDANDSTPIPNSPSAAAKKPGGGVRVKAIDARWLAKRVLRASQTGQLELVVPGNARILFALQQMSACWGDWIIRRYMG